MGPGADLVHPVLQLGRGPRLLFETILLLPTSITSQKVIESEVTVPHFMARPSFICCIFDGPSWVPAGAAWANNAFWDADV